MADRKRPSIPEAVKVEGFFRDHWLCFLAMQHHLHNLIRPPLLLLRRPQHPRASAARVAGTFIPPRKSRNRSGLRGPVSGLDRARATKSLSLGANLT